MALQRGCAVASPCRDGGTMRLPSLAQLGTLPPRLPTPVPPLQHRIIGSRPAVVVSAAAGTTAAPPAASLSAELRNTTAVLQAGGATVYVLGVSHVSRASCRHIRELIAAVQPDTVQLELCKERTGLLVDPAVQPSLWHASDVSLAGPLPAGAPMEAALLAQLKCARGEPITGVDIEDDAVALLATGLFRSVKPSTSPPPPTASPAFVLGPGGRLRTAVPLGTVQFTLVARKLPAVAQFTVECADDLDIILAKEQIDAATAVGASSSGTALSNLLLARKALLEALPADADLALSGIESGMVVAKVQRVAAGGRRALTGLESSAAGGQGHGIDSFKRQARAQTQVTLPAGGLNILLKDQQQQQSGKSSAASGAAESGGAGSGVDVRPWTEAELQAAESGSNAGTRSQKAGGMEGAFASALTQTYARLQADAGRSVGISPGTAWRAALEAAAAAGTRRVLLGDRPAGVTATRLARAVWSSCAPFLLGALPAAAASAIIVSQGLEGGSPAAPVLAAALPLAISALPIAAPLLEVWRFSKMAAAEIEEVVRMKEPLQAADGSAAAQQPLKLWGEDALLNWPGAMEPVIHERDEYMARAMAAVAAARPEGLTPAFVRSAGADGRVVYRYAMPEGGDPGVCPPGRGDGVFGLAKGDCCRVVAIVGTAHVRGIVAAWGRVALGGDVRLDAFL